MNWRQFKREVRVGMIRAKKNPVCVFTFWVLLGHIMFVMGAATATILGNG